MNKPPVLLLFESKTHYIIIYGNASKLFLLLKPQLHGNRGMYFTNICEDEKDFFNFKSTILIGILKELNQEVGKTRQNSFLF